MSLPGERARGLLLGEVGFEQFEFLVGDFCGGRANFHAAVVMADARFG